MVGYSHYSMTVMKIWDQNFRVVWAQSEVIIDEERNRYGLFTTGGIDIFRLPEEAEFDEELYTGDGLLRAEKTAIGKFGDGLLHGRRKDISGMGDGHSSGDYGHTDDVTDVDCHLPDDHTLRRSLVDRRR